MQCWFIDEITVHLFGRVEFHLIYQCLQLMRRQKLDQKHIHSVIGVLFPCRNWGRKPAVRRVPSESKLAALSKSCPVSVLLWPTLWSNWTDWWGEWNGEFRVEMKKKNIGEGSVMSEWVMRSLYRNSYDSSCQLLMLTQVDSDSGIVDSMIPLLMLTQAVAIVIVRC
jgi:hypothetical protein